MVSWCAITENHQVRRLRVLKLSQNQCFIKNKKNLFNQTNFSPLFPLYDYVKNEIMRYLEVMCERIKSNSAYRYYHRYTILKIGTGFWKVSKSRLSFFGGDRKFHHERSGIWSLIIIKRCLVVHEMKLENEAQNINFKNIFCNTFWGYGLRGTIAL